MEMNISLKLCVVTVTIEFFLTFSTYLLILLFQLIIRFLFKALSQELSEAEAIRKQ